LLRSKIRAEAISRGAETELGLVVKHRGVLYPRVVLDHAAGRQARRRSETDRSAHALRKPLACRARPRHRDAALVQLFDRPLGASAYARTWRRFAFARLMQQGQRQEICGLVVRRGAFAAARSVS
jgi:hypothetical protein